MKYEDSMDDPRTVLAVQTQLNRLGCETGVPDGVIGPNSRAALKEFAEATGIDFRVADLRSQLFLRKVEKQFGQICR